MSIDGVLYKEGADGKPESLLLYPTKKSETAFTIPDNITRISYSAFWKCLYLKEIMIPSSVEYLDMYAIYMCESLTTIHYNGTKAQWNAIDKSNFWFENWMKKQIITIICTDGKITVSTNDFDDFIEEF